MADRQLIAKRVRMALGAGAFRSRDEAAAKISAELGYEISREILRKTEEGTRGAELELLDAIATVCGVERELVRGDQYVFVPNDVRDLDGAKGLYLNPGDHDKWQDWPLIVKAAHAEESPEMDPFWFYRDAAPSEPMRQEVLIEVEAA